MTLRRIIPDSYTDYEDGHLGVIPASLANVEAKIGAAEGGQPFKVFTLSGPDAKAQAKTIFQGGPLLKAIEEAFDAGSTRMYALRLGNAQRASIVLKDIEQQNVMLIKGPYGSVGNNHYVNVTHRINHMVSGYCAVYQGSPPQVVEYDSDFQEVKRVNLGSEVVSVAGVEADLLPPSLFEEPVQFVNARGFYVLGYGSAPDNHPKIWYFGSDGVLVPERTLNLSGFIPQGEIVTGMVNTMQWLVVTTDKRMLIFETDGSLVETELDFAALGMATPDVSSGTVWIEFDDLFISGEVVQHFMFLDRSENRIYHTILEEHTFGAATSVDISSWVGGDAAEGIAVDGATGDVLVATRSAQDESSRLLRFGIDWEAAPDPTVSFLSEQSLPDAGIRGMGHHIVDADITTTVTIQDRNQSPVVTRAYEGAGTLLTSTEAVCQAISDGGVYSAELLKTPAYFLWPSLEGGDGQPDPSWYDPMTGGSDVAGISNADYLAGLEAMKAKTDVAWIHAVGATSTALWTAILLHCDEMAKNYHAERFAILETPQFSSDYDEGSAGYLTDLQDYVEGIVAMMAQVGDKNAVVFAGGAKYLDSDGNEYTHPVTASCGGVMAGLEVQKSLINKPVKNILKLVPEFSPGHIETLIQHRVNCVRFKPGRGFIIAHSLTAASLGSDYSRINDLRAVYYGSKAAREAGQPYVGEENDAAGEGLRRLESAMARPLEQMRDGGQIDIFELSAVSTAQDRLLGDVYVSLGIQPRRAMEMIYINVYLK